MKILALDIATVTGWSVLEDGKLIEFGSINLKQNMSINKKLNQLHVEIKRLITKHSPDYAVIEDIILGISGPKILTYLSRLNGVALFTCYEKLKDNVILVKPTEWKCDSLSELDGKSQKWKILYEVVRHFKFEINGSYEDIENDIKEMHSSLDTINDIHKKTKLDILECNKKLNRKRNPLTDTEKVEVKNNLKKLKLNLQKQKNIIKKETKEFAKKSIELADDLTVQTGVTTDIADSICMAIYAEKRINND